MRLLRIPYSLAFGGSRYTVGIHIRAMIYLKKMGMIRCSEFVSNRLQRKYGVFISHLSVITETLRLPHPVGIVVGRGVRLGERVTIFQNVTIGAARIGDWRDDSYPSIGDDTVIFAGAVIVGEIKIGSKCVIGANAVVTSDVPDHTTAVGVPARLLNKERSSASNEVNEE